MSETCIDREKWFVFSSRTRLFTIRYPRNWRRIELPTGKLLLQPDFAVPFRQGSEVISNPGITLAMLVGPCPEKIRQYFNDFEVMLKTGYMGFQQISFNQEPVNERPAKILNFRFLAGSNPVESITLCLSGYSYSWVYEVSGTIECMEPHRSLFVSVLRSLTAYDDIPTFEASISNLQTADREKVDTAIFFFDYTAMNMEYGNQAYRSIQLGLDKSVGICSFADGDLEVATGARCSTGDMLKNLCSRGDILDGFSENSPLACPQDTKYIPGYLVSMWTDHSSNIQMIHSHLISSNSPGYWGCIILKDEAGGHLEFLQTVVREMHLMIGITFVNGKVVPNTSKYGIR
jgi:hypothetical protein